MVAAAGKIENGVKVCRLSRTCEHGGTAALKSADACGNMVAGGICKTAVKIAGGFKVKELAHSLAAVVFKCCTLDNGYLTRLAVSRLIAALNANRSEIFHLCILRLFF